MPAQKRGRPAGDGRVAAGLFEKTLGREPDHGVQAAWVRVTNLMTGDSGSQSALHNSKDVPQFAPNFTVYVLPPDAVCLYSEDRKFFLHGELYCALATAIGKGGKSLRQIAAELGRRYPADKIQEALGAGGRVLIRWSGTEPKLRIMLEGPHEDRIREWAKELAEAAKEDLPRA